MELMTETNDFGLIRFQYDIPVTFKQRKALRESLLRIDIFSTVYIDENRICVVWNALTCPLGIGPSREIFILAVHFTINRTCHSV